jgi:ribulose-phosphate 3-epimerase
MVYIAPSVLAADFSQLGEEVRRVEEAGANYLHLDVMDGIFVPNITFGAPVISAIRRKTSLIFDVHLMIKDPQRYIDDFIKAGADIITIHYESCENPLEVIRQIRAHEVKAGISISPKTPAQVLLPLLDEVDMILVMTVEPGFGGQKFMPDMMDKVRLIRKELLRRKLNADIEVDGGISEDNAALVSEAGANILVAGSAIFKSRRPRLVISRMRSEAETHPFRIEK